jgi:hypothetical protein
MVVYILNTYQFLLNIAIVIDQDQSGAGFSQVERKWAQHTGSIG